MYLYLVNFNWVLIDKIFMNKRWSSFSLIFTLCLDYGDHLSDKLPLRSLWLVVDQIQI